MPEHVHLLLSEPERGNLAVVLQMLKQIVSQKVTDHRKLSPRTKAGALPFSRSWREGGAYRGHDPFWQPRYYDFNVFRERKLADKLDYMHQNPVQRGLVTRPEDWKWSSARHYIIGEECGVEIESHWTAHRREQLGANPVVRRRDVS